MYTANVAGEVFEYKDINELDAYNIAIQVLQEMEAETFYNPEGFKKRDGFSSLYNLLIYKTCAVAERIYEASNIKRQMED